MAAAFPEDPARRAKAELRAAALVRRRAMGAGERARRDAPLAALLLARPEVQHARAVALYAALPDEPPTDALLTHLRQRGVAVLLPVLEETGGLSWRLLTEDPLVPGPHGVRQPGPAAPTAHLGDAEVVVVPGLAFDPSGGRPGRGGGAYDRALAEVATTALVVGLGYDEDVVDRVPTEPHDRPVHAVATPTRWLPARSAR